MSSEELMRIAGVKMLHAGSPSCYQPEVSSTEGITMGCWCVYVWYNVVLVSL